MKLIDKSVAYLAWLSPHTCCEDNFEKTKIQVIKEIFPLIGIYYFFKKSPDGELYIETKLNEIYNNLDNVPDNFYERILNERVVIKFKPDNDIFKKVREEVIENNFFYVGKFTQKGFAKDIKVEKGEHIAFVPERRPTLLSILQFNYLQTYLSKLPKDYKKILCDIILSAQNDVAQSDISAIFINIRKTSFQEIGKIISNKYLKMIRDA